MSLREFLGNNIIMEEKILTIEIYLRGLRNNVLNITYQLKDLESSMREYFSTACIIFKRLAYEVAERLRLEPPIVECLPWIAGTSFITGVFIGGYDPQTRKLYVTMSSMIETIFHEMYHYYQHVTIPDFIEKYYREFEERGYFGNRYEIDATNFAIRQVSEIHKYDVYKEYKTQIDAMLKYLPEIVRYIQSIGAVLITLSLTEIYLSDTFKRLPSRVYSLEEIYEYCYYTNQILNYIIDFLEMYEGINGEFFREARLTISEAKKKMQIMCNGVKDLITARETRVSELAISMIYRDFLDTVLDVLNVMYLVFLEISRYTDDLYIRLKRLIVEDFLEEFFA